MPRLRLPLALLAALLLWVPACSEHDPAEPTYDLQLESAHFTVMARATHATTADLEATVAYGEPLFDAIVALLGTERVADRKVEVVLMGPAGTGSVTRVDELGRMVMYRHSARLGGYLGAFAHELTHALRYDFWQRFGTWSWHSFGFFEDGFAEFVALTVDPEKQGFPFFGFPEDLVAGYWVVSGQAIPPHVLRPRNQELNSPCQSQAYPQRASWFRYVDETYGREATLALAYSEVEVTDDVARTVLGASLTELDAGWEQWVSARYAAIPNVDSLTVAYRQWVPDAAICVQGRDY